MVERGSCMPWPNQEGTAPKIGWQPPLPSSSTTTSIIAVVKRGEEEKTKIKRKLIDKRSTMVRKEVGGDDEEKRRAELLKPNWHWSSLCGASDGPLGQITRTECCTATARITSHNPVYEPLSSADVRQGQKVGMKGGRGGNPAQTAGGVVSRREKVVRQNGRRGLGRQVGGGGRTKRRAKGLALVVWRRAVELSGRLWQSPHWSIATRTRSDACSSSPLTPCKSLCFKFIGNLRDMLRHAQLRGRGEEAGALHPRRFRTGRLLGGLQP